MVATLPRLSSFLPRCYPADTASAFLLQRYPFTGVVRRRRHRFAVSKTNRTLCRSAAFVRTLKVRIRGGKRVRRNYPVQLNCNRQMSQASSGSVHTNRSGLVHTQRGHHVTHTPESDMKKSGHRPATAGAHSDRRHYHDSVEDDNGSQEHRPPARPSTQRSARNSPRTENVTSRASLSRRRESGRSGSLVEGSDPSENNLSEIAILRQKLSENELAKAQSQVQFGGEG